MLTVHYLHYGGYVSLFRCGDCQHGRFCLKESLAPQLYYILHPYGGDPSLAGD